ncbi:MAG: hypothetical protein ACOC2D_17195 [Spirochaetota bacterium]
MLMFMVKKAFFDMWDHFLSVVLMNLGFIVLLTIPLLLPSVLVDLSVSAALASQVIGGLIAFVYAGTISMAARDIANYERPEFGKVLGYLKDTWKSSLVLGLIWAAVVLIVVVGFPVYANMGNLLGLAAIVFLFWALVIWTLASQFYLPVRAQLDTRIGKVIRKSFIIFFDNTFFAIVTGIGSVLVIVGSVFTALLIPGIAGLLIWHQVALKLRVLKYDYLEEHPDANRRQIPWDALLIDERERVGKRTLRGMIFPWKE